ncbi:MAG: uroporphyrinogen decarboxylase family protein, partial [Oceanipulchritudo sp.]
MSKARALAAIQLQPTDRIPSQEWIDHPGFVRELTGIDPYRDPAGAILETVRKLDLDWIWDLPREAVAFAEGEASKVTEDGVTMTRWGFSGSIREEESLFADADDVLTFSPLEEARTHARGVRILTEAYRLNRYTGPLRAQEEVGDSALVTGLYYTTLFQSCIMSFGWENFLEAAASEPEAFGRILDEFTEISVENIRQWVQSPCPVCFFHDDLAISSGLVFPPAWYRREIFPRYEQIFEPARQAGKRIHFVSDGRYEELMPDLHALGVRGFMIDPDNDLQATLARFGHDCAVLGNISTHILTSGSVDDVRAEVRRCADLGKHWPGYFFRAAGDLPHNIPLANIRAYFEAK